MFYQCPVCKDKLSNTPYYETKHGKVCEDCYEFKNGAVKYSDFCEKYHLEQDTCCHKCEDE